MLFYGSVNLGKNENPSNASNVEKDSQIKAGETSFDMTNTAESAGLAVFKKDKFIGELNGIETICHSIITNNLKSCNISIPDPQTPNNTIDLYLYQQNKTNTSVSIVNGSPSVSCNISLNARILSMEKDSSYQTEDRIYQIQESANLYMQQQVLAYLYKTSKDLNSDIAGIGKKAVSNFITQQEWDNYNWLDNYKNSFFDVTMQIHTKSSFLLSET